MPPVCAVLLWLGLVEQAYRGVALDMATKSVDIESAEVTGHRFESLRPDVLIPEEQDMVLEQRGAERLNVFLVERDRQVKAPDLRSEVKAETFSRKKLAHPQSPRPSLLEVARTGPHTR